MDTPLNFGWAYFDGDADSDAAFLSESGEVQLFFNERSASFVPAQNIPQSAGAVDIEVADINNDGNFDLLVWNRDGIFHVYYDQKTVSWKSEKLVEIPAAFSNAEAGRASLYAVDIDNNGQ